MIFVLLYRVGVVMGNGFWGSFGMGVNWLEWGVGFGLGEVYVLIRINVVGFYFV